MSERSAPAAYLAFVISLVISAVVLDLLGFLPSRMVGGAEAIRAMFAGTGVVVIGSLVGAVPILLASLKESRSPTSGPTVVLLSMIVRLVTVVLLSFVLVLYQGEVSSPFLVWLAIAYMALLVVDTRYAMTLIKSL
jgi:uncharacterized membrane protein